MSLGVCARRVDFFKPPDVAPSFISTILATVGHEVDADRIEAWTNPERLLAYDYGIRVRIRVEALANNTGCAVELRPCPSFVIAADVWRAQMSMWLHLVQEERRAAAV